MRTNTLLCMTGWMLLARAVTAQDVSYDYKMFKHYPR
jgi:hypothetical protein